MAIYENVKVKRDAVKVVLAMVKAGFYQDEDSAKLGGLRALNESLSNIYEVEIPKLKLKPDSHVHYEHGGHVIVITNYSIISYLHEFRHHLQVVAGKMYKDMTKEEDARAWSLRVFKSACPKSFERSVKAGKVLFVKWDEEQDKVVDDVAQVRAEDSIAEFFETINIEREALSNE